MMCIRLYTSSCGEARAVDDDEDGGPWLFVCVRQGEGEPLGRNRKYKFSFTSACLAHLFPVYSPDENPSTPHDHFLISLPEEFHNRSTSHEMKRVKGGGGPGEHKLDTSWTQFREILFSWTSVPRQWFRCFCFRLACA